MKTPIKLKSELQCFPSKTLQNDPDESVIKQRFPCKICERSGKFPLLEEHRTNALSNRLFGGQLHYLRLKRASK